MIQNFKDAETFFDVLEELIDSRVKQAIKEAGVLTSTSGTVQSVNGNNITVRLAGNTVDITVPNRNNLTLATNDEVEVYLKGGDLGNAYVMVKRS